jgi:CHAT domain-containing protein
MANEQDTLTSTTGQIFEEISTGQLSNLPGLRLAPLPYAEREIVGICALFTPDKCTSLVGREATESALREQLRDPYSILHIASHALINQSDPKQSCIVVAPSAETGDDGILIMEEIFNLPHAPDMVVLSSCRSGVGKVVRGEGMVSLSRAFFYAGSRSLVVSLWPVDDQSTSRWMIEFYRCIASGMDREEAVRAVKIAFLHSDTPALKHAYYWAPFIMMGRSR